MTSRKQWSKQIFAHTCSNADVVRMEFSKSKTSSIHAKFANEMLPNKSANDPSSSVDAHLSCHQPAQRIHQFNMRSRTNAGPTGPSGYPTAKRPPEVTKLAPQPEPSLDGQRRDQKKRRNWVDCSGRSPREIQTYQHYERSPFDERSPFATKCLFQSRSVD